MSFCDNIVCGLLAWSLPVCIGNALLVNCYCCCAGPESFPKQKLLIT